MKKIFDIVVVGAGIVGLATAALLGQSACRDKLRITVVDAGKKPVFDCGNDIALRVSAISRGSMQVLQKLGAWENITEQRACPYRSMRVWDSRESVEGPDTLRFDAADFAVPELGFIAENVLIQHALLQRLDDLDIQRRFTTPIVKIIHYGEPGQIAIELQGDGTITADLLVGADGTASLVRESAGIELRTWNYPQSALVTHAAPERNHQGTAWQRFLKKGPLALLPLKDGRVSVVWSTTPERATSALSASDEELADLLTRASDNILGRLEITGPRGSFPLKSQHAEQYVMPGLALVGDAAHAVHPLAGQGANLGIADAAALATVVSDAIMSGEYPGDLPTLRRYERQRKGANKSMLHFIDALNRLFLEDSEAIASLRTSGMRLFNRSGPIQRRAVQVALGISV